MVVMEWLMLYSDDDVGVRIMFRAISTNLYVLCVMVVVYRCGCEV